MNFRIVFLGPPGAGKGTQASRIANALKVAHVSTGEMLRDEVSRGSDLGNKVKGILDAGNLVPDDLMLSIIETRLSRADCADGFILDGFPRTVKQAQDLSALLSRLSLPLTHVIELKVPESILMERIRSRAGQSAGARSDDNAEVLANRLKVYWELTAPVTQFYNQSGSLVEIDGLGSVDQVSSRISFTLMGSNT